MLLPLHQNLEETVILGATLGVGEKVLPSALCLAPGLVQQEVHYTVDSTGANYSSGYLPHRRVDDTGKTFWELNFRRGTLRDWLTITRLWEETRGVVAMDWVRPDTGEDVKVAFTAQPNLRVRQTNNMSYAFRVTLEEVF